MNKSDAEGLKASMQKAMLRLFNEGALPREVPTLESISNLTLIELNPQKLLNGPTAAEDANLTEKEPPLTVGEIEAVDSKSSHPTAPEPKKASKRSKK